MIQTVKVENLEFDVSVDGAVSQIRCVSPSVLDEVRMAAAEQFLATGTLTHTQREYWFNVRRYDMRHMNMMGGK